MSTFSTSQLPDAAEIDRIVSVLGQSGRLTYAPPHIYPMSAPAFRKTAEVHRPRPASGPLGLYAHIPFCNYACSFCFYVKRIGESAERMERYVEALEKELSWVEPGTPLTQLYVGGGTPTALPPHLLDRTLAAIFARFDGGSHIHTVESSPESLKPEHLEVLHRHGIGRVSMGIQSMREGVLDKVHRKHDGNAALDSCRLLVDSGLIVNIDLIFGLPGQAEEDFRADFQAVVDAGVHSVTTYNLRVNEKTPVARELAEDERLDLKRLLRWRAFVKKTAEESGFQQTRWHTFRRLPGEDAVSRKASTFEDVTGQGNQFGVGVSARSRLDHVVYRNLADIEEYIHRIESGRSTVEEVFPLEDTARRTRFIALTLGDGKPLDRREYESAIGQSFDEEYGEVVRRLGEAGLLEDTGTAITMTESGKLAHDRVTLAFYPETVKEWLREREQAVVASGKLDRRKRD